MNTAPPEIDGYEFLQPLGAGGFADVFQYEQELPRRSVAVKVLRDDLSDEGRDTFRDEANLMAQLSAHPSIVSVHAAAVLPDGRPYLVMEHCPRPNLGVRFRADPLPVDEALTIGVQLAGAVESAHRLGVLHRDIKPANVLVTSVGRPALSDFGIAATLGIAASGGAAGMSVPWSAPESLDGSWSGPATDVYSLGATVYSLLAGRAPFETADGPNAPADQAARIRSSSVPPTGRADVPATLEKVLATAMSRSPQARYTSALSLGRALQKVQRELGQPVTTVDVLDATFTGGVVPGDETLSVRPIDRTAGRTGAGRASVAATSGAAFTTGASVPAAPPEPAAPAEPVYLAPAAVAPQTASGATAAEATVMRAPAGRAAAAATTPVAIPLPPAAPAPKRAVWPGVLLDVVLVLAVAGAAAGLLLL